LPDVPNVALGDPGRLRQVLVNLVGNAINSPSAARSRAAETESRTADDTVLHYFVSDSGMGIPEEKTARDLRAVQTAMDRRRGGSAAPGSALTISSTLVELMGGPHLAGERAARGQHVPFHRAARRQRTPAGAARRQPHDSPGAHRRRQQRQPARAPRPARAMEDAADGSRQRRGRDTRAQRRARARPSLALVLLDANMPEMDGFEVARRIHGDANLAGATIMMLSSSGRYDEGHKCREVGISTHLTSRLISGSC